MEAGTGRCWGPSRPADVRVSAAALLVRNGRAARRLAVSRSGACRASAAGGADAAGGQRWLHLLEPPDAAGARVVGGSRDPRAGARSRYRAGGARFARWTDAGFVRGDRTDAGATAAAVERQRPASPAVGEHANR